MAAADPAPLRLQQVPFLPPQLLHGSQRRRAFGAVSDAQHLATLRRLAHRWYRCPRRPSTTPARRTPAGHGRHP
jgi:hypothetical protein